MASKAQVKEYLACWLQLGKGLVLCNEQVTIRLQSIVCGELYSPEFEACWEQVCSPTAGDCYLEGTELTVKQLLSEQWAMIDCGRCAMPFPVPIAGVASPICPCHDLPSWPNQEVPLPRPPVSTTTYLQGIHQRLLKHPN
jgi:hypothetical protein